MISNHAELLDALSRTDFARLIGTREGDWLEFKESGYPVDRRGKWELAKDIAALGNRAEGGSLVIGVRTERMPSSMEERAARIVPMAKELIDVGWYRDVLIGTVHPLLRLGPDSGWFPAGDEREGLLLLDVVPQPHSRPFVVSPMAEQERGAVGIPIRLGDRTVWLPAARVHQLMHAAYLESEGMAAGAGATTGPIARGERDASAERVLVGIEQDEEWSQYGLYVLEAVFEDPLERDPDVLERLADVLASPPNLRPDGFGLRFPRSARRRDFSWRTDTRAIEVAYDRLIAIATATPHMLGWAYTDPMWEPADPVIVNPFALIEFTLDFCRLVEGKVIPLFGGGSWRISGRCVRFRSANVMLRSSPNAVSERLMATNDDWRVATQSTGDPEVTAYRLIGKIYELFGLTGEALNWIAPSGRIDSSALKR